MFELTRTQIIVVACLLLALPLWLAGLWRAARVMLVKKDGAGRSWRLPRLTANGLTVRLKLFLIGTVVLFAGFLAVILFRDAVYAAVIAFGTLFLTGLFFACHFRNLSDDERQLFRSDPSGNPDLEPEEMLLLTHPVWMSEHPGLFALGLVFTLGGGVLTAWDGDPALLLMSVFGLVFLLHLWSFRQLNSLIVTNRLTALREGLPAEQIRLILHLDVVAVSVERTFLDRLFRVSSIEISDGSDDPVRIKLKNAGEVKRLIEEHRREEAVQEEAVQEQAVQEKAIRA